MFFYFLIDWRGVVLIGLRVFFQGYFFSVKVNDKYMFSLRLSDTVQLHAPKFNVFYNSGNNDKSLCRNSERGTQGLGVKLTTKHNQCRLLATTELTLLTIRHCFNYIKLIRIVYILLRRGIRQVRSPASSAGQLCTSPFTSDQTTLKFNPTKKLSGTLSHCNLS